MRRIRARLSRRSVERIPGRVWHLRGSALFPSNGTSVAGNIVAVPSEDVLTAALDLPLPSRKARLAALPFALEDRIADPLEAVHLALGIETAPRRYLVGAVRHDLMRRWLETIRAAGLEHAALVPDALLIPRPGEGQWRVAIDGGRALVRGGDGSGFVVATPRLVAAWIATGRPPCMASGDELPEAMRPATIGLAEDGPPDIGVPLDLAQGRYRPRDMTAVSAVARRLLAIAAAGAAAHAAIAMADTVALRHMAGEREREARALARAVLPGIGADDDLVDVAAARLPVAARRPDRMLPLLGRASAALAATGRVDIAAMSYDDATGRLVLAVAPGSEARLAGLLAGAGLMVATAPGRVVARAGRA